MTTGSSNAEESELKSTDLQFEGRDDEDGDDDESDNGQMFALNTSNVQICFSRSSGTSSRKPTIALIKRPDRENVIDVC